MKFMYIFLFLAPVVKHVLPEVVEMLPNDDTGTDLPTAATGCLCQILTNLSQRDSEHVRAIINQGALPKIINISSKDNGSVRGALLMYSHMYIYVLTNM